MKQFFNFLFIVLNFSSIQASCIVLQQNPALQTPRHRASIASVAELQSKAFVTNQDKAVSITRKDRAASIPKPAMPVLHWLLDANRELEVITTSITTANIAQIYEEKTVLQKAFQKDNPAAARVIIKKMPSKLMNWRDTQGNTALHYAVSSKAPEEEIAKAISRALKKGADPNIANKGELTPVYVAALYRRPLLIRQLLKKANPDAPNTPNAHGVTPLLICLMPTNEIQPPLPEESIPLREAGKLQESIEKLLAKNANPLIETHQLVSPLLYAAQKDYNIETIFNTWLKKFKREGRKLIIQSVKQAVKPEPILITINTSSSSIPSANIEKLPAQYRLHIRMVQDGTCVAEFKHPEE